MTRATSPHDPLRRQLLRLGVSLLISPTAAARAQEETLTLGRQLGEAARRGGAVRLRRGVTLIRGLEAPDGLVLIGSPGGSTLRLLGAGPLLFSRGARALTFENIAFDGAGGFAPKDSGLLDFQNVAHLKIHGCTIKNAGADGLRTVRCGGVFAQNSIERARAAAFRSLNSLEFDIDGNHIRDCDDNGVLIWSTSEVPYDGSRVRNNVIEDIRNVSGGDGPYGNGVCVWRASSVRVERNRISRCAYTAVRNNDAHDVEVVGNICKTFGEKAMYAEFGAKRVAFRDNFIEDAGAGIAMSNADTDHCVATGNTIRNLRDKHPDPAFGPAMFWLTAIEGERNCLIAGNKVAGPAWIGIFLGGWRENMRVEDNVVEGADYGVGFANGPDAGESRILRNRIIGARKAAICAFAGPAPVGGDLLHGVARMQDYPRLTLEGNHM